MQRFAIIVATIAMAFTTVHGQYSGTTRAAYDVELAFTLTGRVASVAVQPGDHVEAGQVLVQLDDSMQRHAVTMAQMTAENDTAVRAAEQKLAIAKASQRENESQAELALKQAQYEHAMAQIRRAQAELMLAEHQLKAPAAGVVQRVEVREASVVTPGRAVVRLVQPNKLWVEVRVPTQAAAHRQVGESAQVHRPGSEHIYTGKVIFMSQEIDAQTDTRLVRVEIAADAQADPLLIGEPVVVHFTDEGRAGRPDGV